MHIIWINLILCTNVISMNANTNCVFSLNYANTHAQLELLFDLNKTPAKL